MHQKFLRISSYRTATTKLEEAFHQYHTVINTIRLNFPDITEQAQYALRVLEPTQKLLIDTIIKRSIESGKAMPKIISIEEIRDAKS